MIERSRQRHARIAGRQLQADPSSLRTDRRRARSSHPLPRIADVLARRRGLMVRRGFTLVELLVALVVAGIVLLLAVPSLAGLLARSRLDTVSNVLITHMAVAREQAVSRGVGVSMCSSSDGRTCSGNLDWMSGWIVFLEPAADGREIDAADIIRVGEAAGNGIHLRASHSYFTYLPDGTLDVRGPPPS